MLGTWDAERYRQRAQQWRAEANALPPGKERDACMVLAIGYANLAMFIDEADMSEAHRRLKTDS